MNFSRFWSFSCCKLQLGWSDVKYNILVLLTQQAMWHHNMVSKATAGGNTHLSGFQKSDFWGRLLLVSSPKNALRVKITPWWLNDVYKGSQPVIEQQRFQNWKDCTIYEKVVNHRRSRRLLSCFVCLPYVLFQDKKNCTKWLVFVYEATDFTKNRFLYVSNRSQLKRPKSGEIHVRFLFFWKVPKTLVALSKSGHITRSELGERSF